MHPALRAAAFFVAILCGFMFATWPGWAILGEKWSFSVGLLIFIFDLGLAALLAAILCPSE